MMKKGRFAVLRFALHVEGYATKEGARRRLAQLPPLLRVGMVDRETGHTRCQGEHTQMVMAELERLGLAPPVLRRQGTVASLIRQGPRLRQVETVVEEPPPRVRVSLGPASRLAAAMAAMGTLNTTVAGFLLGDPFRAGVEELRAELTTVRNAGVSATRAAAVASESETELDLDRVAEPALETVDGALWLVLRAAEMARRAGIGPGVEPQVARLEEAVAAIAELLPGAGRTGRWVGW